MSRLRKRRKIDKDTSLSVSHAADVNVGKTKDQLVRREKLN